SKSNGGGRGLGSPQVGVSLRETDPVHRLSAAPPTNELPKNTCLRLRSRHTDSRRARPGVHAAHAPGQSQLPPAEKRYVARTRISARASDQISGRASGL